jgi:hypothetical protein
MEVGQPGERGGFSKNEGRGKEIMNRFVIYLVWAFVGFMGLAIVILLLAWMAPIFYALARPFIRIFKKDKKE